MREQIWSDGLKKKILSLSSEELDEINKEGLDYMWKLMIEGNNDLHIHSNASDGHDSPPKIIQDVMNNKLDAFALTDHDTIDGFRAISIVYDKLKQMNIELPDFIPGMELNMEYEGQDIHILAFFPMGTFWLMKDFLEERVEARRIRNQAIVAKAQEFGMKISEEDLSSMGGGIIGRVHIANLLLRMGYVDSVSDAFDTYLNEGKPFFVDKILPSAEYALAKVREAGGIPVLAHPAEYTNWIRGEDAIGREEIARKISELKDLGLQGVEVMYQESTFAESREIAHISRELGLLPTAGSDYHGSHRPRVHVRNKNDDPRKFLSLFYDEFRAKKDIEDE